MVTSIKAIDHLNSKQKQFDCFLGVDEVGRGPLAGPVVACSTLFIGNADDFSKFSLKLKKLGVTDSKKLNTKKREILLSHLKIDSKKLKPDKIYSRSIEENLEFHFVLAEVSSERIDEINILQASLEAMSKTIHSFSGQLKKQKYSFIHIDGKKLPTLDQELNKKVSMEGFVKGDLHHPIIGVSSIIAKEYRDLLMIEMSKSFPQYGFDQHAGYPTETHRESLKFFGPCLFHRKSFKGVKEYSTHGTQSRT